MSVSLSSGDPVMSLWVSLSTLLIYYYLKVCCGSLPVSSYRSFPPSWAARRRADLSGCRWRWAPNEHGTLFAFQYGKRGDPVTGAQPATLSISAHYGNPGRVSCGTESLIHSWALPPEKSTRTITHWYQL